MATDRCIYLDYAATAPLCGEASRALAPFLDSGIGPEWIDANANALYTLGRTSFSALESARADIARSLGARADEIVFTSSSTEADNAALCGIAFAADEARHIRASKRKPQIIISAIEHDAVFLPAKRLIREGFRVDILPVSKTGHVVPESLASVITDDCVLVSIQMANGEIGSVQPIAELTRIAHGKGAYFHTDATQALGKVPIDLHAIGVDAASFSAHKVGGPKGVGILFLKVRTPFDPLMLGGGQEAGRRSGTQNVAGAVATAAAMKAAVNLQEDESRRLCTLRDRLYAAVSAYPGVHPTVDVSSNPDWYLPSVVNLHIDGFEGPTLVLRFNNEGFCVSAGSACSSGSLDPSRALTALGLTRDAALGELRLSLGRYTTETEIDAFLEAFPRVIGVDNGR